MDIEKFFDDKKMKDLEQLTRSLEGKNSEAINEAVNEAIGNQTSDTVKLINDAFIEAATALAEKMLSQGEGYVDVANYTGLTKNEVLQIQSRLGL